MARAALTGRKEGGATGVWIYHPRKVITSTQLNGSTDLPSVQVLVFVKMSSHFGAIFFLFLLFFLNFWRCSTVGAAWKFACTHTIRLMYAKAHEESEPRHCCRGSLISPANFTLLDRVLMKKLISGASWGGMGGGVGWAGEHSWDCLTSTHRLVRASRSLYSDVMWSNDRSLILLIQ